MKHKSENYKLSAVEYYLIEDNTQEEVCKILFKIGLCIIFKHKFYNNSIE